MYITGVQSQKHCGSDTGVSLTHVWFCWSHLMDDRYGDLYKLIEEAEQGVSKEEGDAMKASFESDTFTVDQLVVYMRQV
jgi:hypothetical protein